MANDAEIRLKTMRHIQQLRNAGALSDKEAQKLLKEIEKKEAFTEELEKVIGQITSESLEERNREIKRVLQKKSNDENFAKALFGATGAKGPSASAASTGDEPSVSSLLYEIYGDHATNTVHPLTGGCKICENIKDLEGMIGAAGPPMVPGPPAKPDIGPDKVIWDKGKAECYDALAKCAVILERAKNLLCDVCDGDNFQAKCSCEDNQKLTEDATESYDTILDHIRERGWAGSE